MKSALSKLSSGVYKKRYASLDRAFLKKESATTTQMRPRSVSMSAGHRNINLAGSFKNGMFFMDQAATELPKLSPIKFGDEYRCKFRVGTQKFGPMLMQPAPGAEAMKLMGLMENLKQQQEQDASFISTDASQKLPYEPWVRASENSPIQRKQIQADVPKQEHKQTRKLSVQSKRLDMLMQLACEQAQTQEKIELPVQQMKELLQEAKPAKEAKTSEQIEKLNNIMEADKANMAKNENMDCMDPVPMDTVQKPTMSEESWRLNNLMNQNKNPKQSQQQRKPSFLKWIYGEAQKDDEASDSIDSNEKEAPEQNVPSFTKKSMDFIRSLLSKNNSSTEEKKQKRRPYPPFLDDVLSEENSENEETIALNMDGAYDGINEKDGSAIVCTSNNESEKVGQANSPPKEANISAVQRLIADNLVPLENL